MREKRRDDRDFDMTSLHEKASGISLSRDYSAHFFRWSFARRFIRPTDQVLEVGCGVERPLFRVLNTATAMKGMDRYLGVDLNPLPAWHHHASEFLGEFNFVTRWKELRGRPGFRPEGFDVTVNLEVIEHMKVEHGRAMLRGIHALLRPGGTLLLSTPCYDGKRHAANHIHEYTVPELAGVVKRVGFEVVDRFGTFMDTKHITRTAPTSRVGQPLGALSAVATVELRKAVKTVHDELALYFDKNALSCFFAPLFPDAARNNLWVLKKP